MTSPAQQRVLDVIREMIAAGRAPSMAEIGAAAGISRVRASQLVARLVASGLIARAPGRHRAIMLVDRTDLAQADAQSLLDEVARRELLPGVTRHGQQVLPAFVRAYRVARRIAPYHVVMFHGATKAGPTIAPATGAEAPIVGTSGGTGAERGHVMDIVRGGVGAVQLGAAVAAGDPLTADAHACAVLAHASGERVFGFADAAGQTGEVIEYIAAPALLDG